MSEALSEFISSSLGGRGRFVATSLVEAFSQQARVFDEPLFANIANFWIGFGIMVGGWFTGWFVEYIILYALGINWRRIFESCRGRPASAGRDHEDDPLFRNYNDPNASVNKPKVVPVVAVSKKFSPNGGTAPSRLTDAVGVTPQSYKEVPVVQVQPDSRLWSGVKPSHVENYVRLSALLGRLVVLVATLMLSFQAAGVNVLSLAASMGIVSLCFTYGGVNLVRNFLSAIYMHWTCKFGTGMYVSLSEGKQGVITAFKSQWTEVTDDLRPSKGRQIHLIPNGSMMDADVTIYPDGPPSEVVIRYFDELKTVNERRVTLGLPSLQPVEGFVGVNGF